MLLPRYPIYIPTKGRADRCKTAEFLRKDGVPFRLVVEPQEVDVYADRFGRDVVLELPFANLGQGSIPARNWLWEHAKATGAERHWCIDDNILFIRRNYRDSRARCEAGGALRVVEDWVDRYENIAIGGLAYTFFAAPTPDIPPFWLNVHVYSCMLIRTDLPFRWRGRYNEDTDLCLQVLSAGWCTVLVNDFNVYKLGTMTTKGGNTAELYQGDGRLRMARSLERQWPGVVDVKRRFKRPQHVVRDSWRGFDTPLKPKPGCEPERYAGTGLSPRLTQVAETVESPRLRAILDEQRAKDAE